jgi:hypothetical protein
MRVVSVLGVIVYSQTSYASWQQGAPVASVAAGLLALLGVWVFFLAGSKVDADQQGIRITAPHGVYELGWAEIKLVEIRNKGNAVRFFGDNKALGYNLLLAGKGKREVRDYVSRSIQERQIPPGRPAGINFLKLRRMYRNARVRGWKLL